VLTIKLQHKDALLLVHAALHRTLSMQHELKAFLDSLTAVSTLLDLVTSLEYLGHYKN